MPSEVALSLWGPHRQCRALSPFPLGSGHRGRRSPGPEERREGRNEVPAPCSPLSYLWPRLPSPAPAEPIRVQPQLHTQRPLTCVRPPRCGPRWPSSNRDSFACSSVVPGQVYVPPINILPPFLPHAPYWDLLRPLRMTLTNQPKLPGPAEPCRPEQPRGARSRDSPQPSRATLLGLQAGDLWSWGQGEDWEGSSL